MNVSEFTETIYLPTVEKTVRKNTYVGYRGAYRKYIKPYFGEYQLDDITSLEIQKFIDSFQKAGAARKAFTTLRQIIHCAQDYELFTKKDPTKKHIKLPKTPGNTNKVLTLEEVKELIDGFYGHLLEACVICSVTLGLRRCESFGLKWGDIDKKTGAVYVHRSRQWVEGEEVVYPPKTKQSTRICYLPSFALKRLNQIRKDDDDWILPVSVRDAPGIYRKHIQKNNLPYTPFMNLRHTWATLTVESGTDISLVAKMMGHTDIVMAYNRYVKPSQKTYINIQRSMDRAMMPSKTSIVSYVLHKLQKLAACLV